MYDGIPFLGKTMYDYMCKNMYECVFVNRKIISSRVGGVYILYITIFSVFIIMEKYYFTLTRC